MHKSATKCNEIIGKWCKNKHGASKIIDTLETYQDSSDQILDMPIKMLRKRNKRTAPILGVSVRRSSRINKKGLK
jgi:hypothetical protein